VERFAAGDESVGFENPTARRRRIKRHKAQRDLFTFVPRRAI
jgi:hypothetical protein